MLPFALFCSSHVVWAASLSLLAIATRKPVAAAWVSRPVTAAFSRDIVAVSSRGMCARGQPTQLLHTLTNGYPPSKSHCQGCRNTGNCTNYEGQGPHSLFCCYCCFLALRGLPGGFTPSPQVGWGTQRKGNRTKASELQSSLALTRWFESGKQLRAATVAID